MLNHGILSYHVLWPGAVDAESGQVSVDILSDPNCWSNECHVLDVLVRIQVGLYTNAPVLYWLGFMVVQL